MRRLLATVGLAAAILTPSFLGAAPALAASCSGAYAAPFYQWVRSNNDVYGVRAPIDWRLDGGLCGTIANDPFAANWIAIVSQSGGQITQIGVEKDIDPISGDPHYCRFWAIGTGTANDYHCPGNSDGSYVYFQIFRYLDPTTHLHYYEVDDCGTGGGYSNCTSKSSSQQAYSDPESQVAAETDYGCVVHLLGTAARPVNFGTSSNPVEGQDGSGSWTTRSWAGYDEGSCTSDYKRSASSYGMSTWDPRNSS